MDSQQMPPFFPMDTGELNIDFIGNLMGMESTPIPQHQPPMNTSLMLEQQFKLAQLQQLQQLQNQIFQQQIALISGTSISDPNQLPDQQRQNCDLPTPGPSAELRAQQQSIEYVSPMILGYLDGNADNPSSYRPPSYRGSTSAPAHIAFSTNTSPHSTVTSPDVELDISPLTSPWLGAESQQQVHYAQQTMAPVRQNKRPATPATEDELARKRQSPSHPSNPTSFAPTSPNFAASATTVKRRATRSASSTPLIRSTRSRRESVGTGPGGSNPAAGSMGPPVQDSPSPVDMPPPAGATDRAGLDPAEHQQQIKPVTPAMMMNIGRLRTDIPTSTSMLPAANGDRKGKGRGAADDEGASNTSKKPTKRSLANGNGTLKTILPAGPMPTVSSHTVNNSSSTSVLSPAPPQVRKTSHKAAEQKRRDSLKTTFDDLRGLLPPIPLSTDHNGDDPSSTPVALFPPRPLLPGALPPRGPPKAGGEGPNKGVSKLQLLMCGNEFIRVLKSRVERRDTEIGDLRDEIKRLRELLAASHLSTESIYGAEPVDLEKDIDACELHARVPVPTIPEEGVDDDDEDG